MIDRVKEVDSFDGLLLDGAWLGEPVEGTDTGREVVERCEVRQIAAVAAEHDLTQVNQAVDGLLDGGEDPRRRALPEFPPRLRGGRLLRWCLRKETSLIVVSMRSTQPYLSYILIEELAKRCLMEVPSMRVENLEPISWASCGLIWRRRKLAFR